MNQSRDLLSMVNSILQATTMESQALKLASHEVNLKEFIDELRLFYEGPTNEGVALLWDYDSDLPVVNTDGGKLRQILQNLINNAIKFTERGRVTISARVTEGNRAEGPRASGTWMEFKVADTGIGIEPEVLPTIFEMFRQRDSSQTRAYGGIGMGLYIAKKLTELLGGRIGVESEVGKGSTFTLYVPYKS